MALTQTAVPTTPSGKATKFPVPVATRPFRINWFYAGGIIGCHLIALLAVLPWFYSRTGVILAILGLYVFGTLGINLCYHRLLTHRGLVCPKLLEHSFAILGLCCLQDTPARWVAAHRRHHQFADEQPDPHSPRVSFFGVISAGSWSKTTISNPWARASTTRKTFAATNFTSDLSETAFGRLSLQRPGCC